MTVSTLRLLRRMITTVNLPLWRHSPDPLDLQGSLPFCEWRRWERTREEPYTADSIVSSSYSVPGLHSRVTSCEGKVTRSDLTSCNPQGLRALSGYSAPP